MSMWQHSGQGSHGCWNLEWHWLKQKHYLKLETLGIGGPGYRKQVCSDFKGLALWNAILPCQLGRRRQFPCGTKMERK